MEGSEDKVYDFAGGEIFDFLVVRLPLSVKTNGWDEGYFSFVGDEVLFLEIHCADCDVAQFLCYQVTSLLEFRLDFFTEGTTGGEEPNQPK